MHRCLLKSPLRSPKVLQKLLLEISAALKSQRCSLWDAPITGNMLWCQIAPMWIHVYTLNPINYTWSTIVQLSALVTFLCSYPQNLSFQALHKIQVAWWTKFRYTVCNGKEKLNSPLYLDNWIVQKNLLIHPANPKLSCVTCGTISAFQVQRQQILTQSLMGCVISTSQVSLCGGRMLFSNRWETWDLFPAGAGPVKKSHSPPKKCNI